MLFWLTVIYIIFFVFLIGTCYLSSLRKYHITAKVLCSAVFVGAACLGNMQSPNNALFWRLLPAFLFCFFGDFFLAWREKKDSETLFLLGLASFLTGHCIFLWAFEILASSNWKSVLLPLAGVMLVLLLLRLKYMKIGKMKVPVIIYAYFVTALFIKCAQTAKFGDESIFFKLVFWGGLIFLISDLIILFLYFYEKKYGIMKFLNLFTYYTATYLLALSVFYG